MKAERLSLSLGVLVPCRNEASVIERKLANLSWVEWPGADRSAHAVVVVDDGSEDATAERARAALAAGFAGRGPSASGSTGTEAHGDRSAPRTLVVANDQTPGKAGALRAGLAALAALDPPVDLIVLSDADVVLEREALVELGKAFVAEPRLGMASGAQRFVRALDSSGLPTGPGGAEARSAAGLFDRITARVRRIEGDRGVLFSVHGQLLAWRAALALEPRSGIAADDIDLALQVRARGATVRLASRARFLEVKTEPGPDAEAQALRRARAYVQVVRSTSPPAESRAALRLQWWFYRYLPLAAPELAVAAALLVLGLAWLAAGGTGLFVALLVLVLGSQVGVGRRLTRLLGVIRRAVRLERAEPLVDRWEMGRS